MKVAIFSSKSYDKSFFDNANAHFNHELVYLKTRLTSETKFSAKGYPAICVFVNDILNKDVLTALKKGGTRMIALRCAGFNNVDLRAAADLGFIIARVPAYSPHAVAEHTIGLILTLNRGLYRAYNRVREGNFSLDGLLGFDLHGRTVGIIGTGKIGTVVARILTGIGCHVLAYDPYQNAECIDMDVKYVGLNELYSQSDIITLHCPLTENTHHMIDKQALSMMKHGVMLINTSRGAVINTADVIEALKANIIGYLGLDVYEQEGDLFFEDLSNQVIQDDVFERLLTFQNVIITGHQGFFTRDAMDSIAQTTLENITAFEKGQQCENQVTVALMK